MKRLAIFYDGTWNDPADRTNVFLLKELVAHRAPDGTEQMRHYDPGVGTRWYDKLLGGSVGRGLSRNVRQGYEWLVRHHQDNDEIYIFGFSRGAYTARSLGGLIACCGLVRPGAPWTTEELYARYRNRKDGAIPIYKLEYFQRTGERPLTTEESSLLASSRRVPIKMIGVWDTVGALGIPWTGMPFIGKGNFYFHNPNLSKIYEHAFQALAIDEHRGAYKPTLWTMFAPDPAPGGAAFTPPVMPPRESAEQRWFVGAHANVGGGYGDDPLSRPPLAWLQSRADRVGLKFTSLVALTGKEHLTAPADSYARFLRGAYGALKHGRRFYRPIGLERRQVNGGWSYPVNEVIDASVFLRMQATDYRPQNLMDWGKTRQRDVPALIGEQWAL
jgi:uncharacterized protein (DUF2235 family)